MNLPEINIRDPYVLLHDNKYYMYGTRAETCWKKANGFDCYVSEDFIQWEGPHEIFRKPDGFWADQNYWAPECIHYRDRFYLITTFGTETQKGIQILVSHNPLDPFEPISNGVVTPLDWTCIDGTIYFEGKDPYLIFSHSFEDVPDGDMCLLKLSEDLTKAVSGVTTLFCAKEAPWANPVPFAEKEFGLKGDVYFTDGPAVHRMDNGKLIILWSSWGEHGYEVGSALSESGKIDGPWQHSEKAVFRENGGHGMLFMSKSGELKYILHHPNDMYQEHPLLLNAVEKEDTIQLGSTKFKYRL